MNFSDDVSWTAVRFRTSPPILLRSEYRDRNNKCGCDLTIEYIKQIWDDQNGICPLTGWALILPQGTAKGWETSDPSNASLDRIDPSKGYVKGNVRFIAYMAKHKLKPLV